MRDSLLTQENIKENFANKKKIKKILNIILKIQKASLNYNNKF